MSLESRVRDFFNSVDIGQVVTPKDLARNFINASPVEVSNIITKLIGQEVIIEKFRVVRPNRQYYTEEFDSKLDIPDTYDQASDIVPVFYRIQNSGFVVKVLA